MIRDICTILIAVSSTGLSACAGMSRSDDATRHVRRAGSAQPTIVLQAGHGDGARSWAPVFEQLAARYTVFAFDRPGYGGCPATGEPRDPCTIADEQHALLSDRRGQRVGLFSEAGAWGPPAP